MPLTYTQYVNTIANLIPTQAADAGFQAMLPNMIAFADNRCYRDLDLLNTVVRDSSATLAANTRTFNLPSSIGTFYVVEEMNVITPASAPSPDAGTRNGLVRSSKEMLDFLWNSSAGSTVPVYFAPVSQSTFVVGPWPNAAYPVEVVGTIRPPQLSSTNATTLLTVYFEDLYVAASMEFAAGYMKNYGAAVDDPQQGVTWAMQYTKLLSGAGIEESRKKATQAGWSPMIPAPQATPPRT